MIAHEKSASYGRSPHVLIVKFVFIDSNPKDKQNPRFYILIQLS